MIVIDEMKSYTTVHKAKTGPLSRNPQTGCDARHLSRKLSGLPISSQALKKISL